MLICLNRKPRNLLQIVAFISYNYPKTNHSFKLTPLVKMNIDIFDKYSKVELLICNFILLQILNTVPSKTSKDTNLHPMKYCFIKLCHIICQDMEANVIYYLHFFLYSKYLSIYKNIPNYDKQHPFQILNRCTLSFTKDSICGFYFYERIQID